MPSNFYWCSDWLMQKTGKKCTSTLWKHVVFATSNGYTFIQSNNTEISANSADNVIVNHIEKKRNPEIRSCVGDIWWNHERARRRLPKWCRSHSALQAYTFLERDMRISDRNEYVLANLFAFVHNKYCVRSFKMKFYSKKWEIQRNAHLCRASSVTSSCLWSCVTRLSNACEIFMKCTHFSIINWKLNFDEFWVSAVKYMRKDFSFLCFIEWKLSGALKLSHHYNSRQRALWRAKLFWLFSKSVVPVSN